MFKTKEELLALSSLERLNYIEGLCIGKDDGDEVRTYICNLSLDEDFVKLICNDVRQNKGKYVEHICPLSTCKGTKNG